MSDDLINEIYRGNLEGMVEIIKNNDMLDLEIESSNGLTPMHLAAARGQVNAIKLLYSVGFDVNRPRLLAGEVVTPLRYAKMWGQKGSQEVLEALGAHDTMLSTDMVRADDTSKIYDNTLLAHMKLKAIREYMVNKSIKDLMKSK